MGHFSNNDAPSLVMSCLLFFNKKLRILFYFVVFITFLNICFNLQYPFFFFLNFVADI